MTQPDTTVHITDSEFTLEELQEFIDTARAIDGIPHDGLVTVSHQFQNGPTVYTLSTSTEYRGKA